MFHVTQDISLTGYFHGQQVLEFCPNNAPQFFLPPHFFIIFPYPLHSIYCFSVSNIQAKISFQQMFGIENYQFNLFIQSFAEAPFVE